MVTPEQSDSRVHKLSSSRLQGSGTWVSLLMNILLVLFFLWYMVGYCDRYVDLSLQAYIFHVAVILVFYLGDIFLSIIIHEAGHLVFGLLSGYSFSSFRIGQWMIARTPEGLHFSSVHIPGTAGQCLLDPPDLDDQRMVPWKLYNAGGALANLITAALFGVLALLCSPYSMWNAFCVCMVLGNLIFAITNGIPLRTKLANNDGYNMLELYRHPEQVRSFWIQVKAAREMAQGRLYSQLPASWTAPPLRRDVSTGISGFIPAVYLSQLQEKQNWQAVQEFLDTLPYENSGIIGMQKVIFDYEKLFAWMMNAYPILHGTVSDRSTEQLHAAQQDMEEVRVFLQDKKNRKNRQILSTQLSGLRLEYGIALLAEGDEKRAAKILEKFDALKKVHPYACDVQLEQSIVQSIQNIYTEAGKTGSAVFTPEQQAGMSSSSSGQPQNTN